MGKKIMNLKITIIFLLCLLLFQAELFSRSVDIDAIYLRKDSSLYNRIISEKFESYTKAGSLLVDSNVAFAVWAGNREIVYVTETAGLNRLMVYNINNHEKREILRFGGAATSLQGRGRGYIILKRMFMKGGLPRGETIWYNPATETTGVLPGAGAFPEFTLSPDGFSVFIEGAEGIYQHRPDSGTKRLFIEKSEYSGLGSSRETVFAYVSPDSSRSAVIKGSGGQYKGIILSSEGKPLPGVTSSTELFWIDNSRIIMRTGVAGSFNGEILDIEKGKRETLVADSLNTNISFSARAGRAALLDNQLICVYDVNDGKLFMSGLEGDDPALSPDGLRLISLFQNRLFVTRLDSLKRSDHKLKGHSAKLAELYRKASADKASHKNDFSSEYIRKKIRVYERHGR